MRIYPAAVAKRLQRIPVAAQEMKPVQGIAAVAMTAVLMELFRRGAARIAHRAAASFMKGVYQT